MDFEKIIKTNRPKIAMSSLVSYLTSLKYVAKHFQSHKNITLNSVEDYIKHSKDIIDMLNNDLPSLKPSVRKTKLAAIIVLLDSKDNSVHTNKVLSEYRKAMMVDELETRKYNDSQQLSDKIKENMIPQSQVVKIFNDYKEKADVLFKMKTLNKNEFQTLQRYVILALYTLIPPRRATDFMSFKIRDPDRESNYLIKGTKTIPPKFVFNIYKNASRLGPNVIEIPKDLERIIHNYSKFNKSDWLLVNSNGDRLKGSQLVNILNDIFDKKISVSMLRHIYLTDKYKNIDLEEIKKDSRDMGSSNIERTLQYVKKE